jgi:hypothetical protein
MVGSACTALLKTSPMRANIHQNVPESGAPFPVLSIGWPFLNPESRFTGVLTLSEA